MTLFIAVQVLYLRCIENRTYIVPTKWSLHRVTTPDLYIFLKVQFQSTSVLGFQLHYGRMLRLRMILFQRLEYLSTHLFSLV